MSDNQNLHMHELNLAIDRSIKSAIDPAWGSQSFFVNAAAAVTLAVLFSPKNDKQTKIDRLELIGF